MPPMPRVFNPSPPDAGPGSAFAGTSLAKKRSRRRQKVRSRSHSPQPSSHTSDTAEPVETNSTTITSISTQQHQFIGQDILDWHDENEHEHNSTSAGNNNLVSASKPGVETSVAVHTSDATATTTNHNGRRDSHQNPNTWTCRRAVGMDTRFLATTQGNIVADRVVQEYAEFVQTTVVRGVAPCWLASTVEKPKEQPQSANKPVVPGKEKHSKKGTSVTSHTSTIRVQLTALGNDKAKKTTGGRALFSLSKVQVQVSAKENKNDKENDKANGAVHIPKKLLAANSWKVLGTLVGSIVAEDARHGSTVDKTPLDISILTNDVSLLCDTNAQSHKTGVARFWKSVAPFFQDSKVGSIQIVMAKTGTLASVVDSEQSDDQDQDQDGDAVMDTELDDSDSHLIHKHDMVISECVRTIQMQLVAQAENDFQKNRSILDAGESPMEISFSVIDNSTVGYQFLVRQWVRDALLAQTLHNSNLELDLPETLDGTQCSVSLDVSYQVFPFSADSAECTRFLTDLQLLSESKLEVVQLVPLSSIDAGLLFGLPMLVRVGLASDLDQFQVMQVLVRSLFSLLNERESAVLLRRTGGKAPKSASTGMFHSSDQMFLLMAKELPKTAHGAPNSGILYQYAHADQLLAEATSPTSEVALLDEDMQRQYADYVEQALECLECSPVNPLYADDEHAALPSLPTLRPRVDTLPFPAVRQASPIAGKKTTVESPGSEASVWNDTAGVGSRGPTLSKSYIAQEHKEDELQDTDEEEFSGFDYGGVSLAASQSWGRK